MAPGLNWTYGQAQGRQPPELTPQIGRTVLKTTSWSTVPSTNGEPAALAPQGETGGR